MRTNRKGFTLIELLVVIAIIAILAAMLFPVFARARESARKIQCLSNVKNVAMAMQMYLTDYDRLMPSEHRPEILSFYEDMGGCPPNVQGAKNNPYLKWQVILDEYIKNRDIWRCPSARYVRDIPVLNPYGGDWWARVVELHDANGECSPFMQCGSPFPPGWGGTVTDSFLQQACGSGNGAIEIGISGLNENMDLKTGEITDPARWLAVVELAGNDSWSTFILAYPDMCKLGCAVSQPFEYDGNTCDLQVFWENCSWTVNCGAGDRSLEKDVQRRKQWARHLGGVNMGFADGHASWMSGEAVLHGGKDYRPFIPEGQKVPDTALAIVGPVGLCMSPEL